MQQFEYKIISAPKRAAKVKGVKTPEDRFAQTMTDIVNDQARAGWEYLRADTLPVEERVGFTGKTTTFQHMLVFRRTLATSQALRPTVSHQDMTGLFDDQPSLDIAFDPAAIAAIRARPEAAASVRLVEPATGTAPAIGPADAKNSGHAAE